MTNPIRVLIAEDHTLLAEGYERLFHTRDDIRIAGFAETYQDIIFQLQSVPADVLLLDLSMPETRNSPFRKLTGFDVLEFIKSHHIGIRKLIVSNHRDYEFIKKAIMLNADGYILKNSNYQRLIQAIHEVFKGRRFFQDEVEQILNEKRRDEQVTQGEGVLLTPREREILRMLGEGLSTEDIVCILKLKKDTINEYRQNLLRKFNARNAAHLVKLAYDMHFLN